MRHVVIVGGGFAGLNCARKLSRRPDVSITLIDKNNYQQFQPLLYQVATGLLSSTNAAFSLRSVLREHSNVDVKMGDVICADLKTRTVQTSDGKKYQGDFLVLAAGSQANFFGTPGADKNAYALYSLQDAELLHSRVLYLLESVDRDPSLVDQGALTFVVVGAGATGAEISGALADLTHKALKGAYRNFDLNRAKILLIDVGHNVLNGFSKKSQEYARQRLQQHGVQLLLGAAVAEVQRDHVLLADGTRILTKTAIWAGGLKASSLATAIGIQAGHGGRIDVETDLSVKGFPGVYALGDFANLTDTDGRPLPQLASVAQQAGKHCAEVIAAELDGKTPPSFRYFDKGILAMIGRSSAVAEIGKNRRELTGPLAFLVWLAVHALLLITTRAKIEAVVEWVWDYFRGTYVYPILDRPDEVAVKWQEDHA